VDGAAQGPAQAQVQAEGGTVIYIVLAGAFVAQVVAAWMFGRAVQNLEREHSRRTDLLINQILHLSGRTWQQPPAEPTENGFDPDETTVARFTTSPTQLTDY
jgi:hypothetical protein